MRYTALSALENNLTQTEGQEYQFRKIAVPVKGENLTLEGLFCTPLRRSGYYYAVEHPKKRIVLHFTAGHIRSDLSALTRQDYHVSVAFVIGRNGTIYQLFSSKYWSGHIGKGLGNTNTGNAQDKASIGIELSNYGYLTERDRNLETYYSRMKDKNGKVAPVDVYCSLTETQAYEKSNVPFRNQSYYATYTEAQYNSLIILLRYLTAQYNIPREFLPEAKRFRATEDVLNFNGIVSHINYRVDGKWDIGPAFDWNKVTAGVQAPTYISTAPATRDHDSVDGETITSEQEIEQLVSTTKNAASEEEPYEDLERSLDETGELKVSETNKEKKKLYALIVGINTYRGDIVLEGRVTFPPLRGCLDDAKKIRGYLQQDTSFESHIELLSDSRATKAEVVRLFKEHLGQAQEGDVALFYFSGHGTQQWADKSIWKSDTDGKLECIACHYDEQTKDDFLLADKELRYLIHQLSLQKPHIVTIFDCCHSADNTRNGAFTTTAFTDTIEKRIPFVFKKRDWSSFIFSDVFSQEKAKEEGEYQVLPEGQHVQISACESDESAVEVAGEGVFTKTLLQVLKTAGGDITYHALRNRVRQYLRNVYEQKPRIYIANGDEALLYTTFLNKSRQESHNAFGDITYNIETGWQLNLGAIHGIGEKTKSIRVIDPQDVSQSYTAKVGLIGTDYSQLIPNTRLDINKVYQGYIEGLLSQNLKVHIKNTDALPEDQQVLINTIHDAAKGYFVAEDQEENAQYVVQARNGKYFITLPNDTFRPLALPLSIAESQAPVMIAQHLQHISQWQYLKNFTNQDVNNTLSSDALQIELFQVDARGEAKPLKMQQNEVDIPYESIAGRWKTSLKVRLTNTTSVNLYCCTLYLSSDFGSSLSFLNPTVYLLEPGNSVELSFRGNPVIPVYLEDVIKWYNWAQQTEYLKFIVSTEEFDAQSLKLEALPKPLTPTTKTRSAVKKGLGSEEQTREEDVNGWTTDLVTIVMRNPELNMISESDVKLMLNNQELTDFALGLYFDAYVDENLQPSYKVKSNIRLISEDGQIRDKGLLQDKILDIANWWARHRLNNHYREVIRRFPDRLRIVSEGDSWFQHPLVLDTIDHLSRTYAIYCVAAAGDTLRNYLSNKKQNGEYFLDAIDEQSPTVFLISGGGNDILGSQFRSYLTDNPDNSQPEGDNPKRFLKNSLFSELDALMDIYRSLFGLLKARRPNLQVIVHGYDYPIKLNDADKGWLGRYMIEKGINREGDRKAIIRLIMDSFNDNLKTVASEFGTVSYLDVRNTVRFDIGDGVDQWYDEIHPNNEGFQQVAMKFIQKINEVGISKSAAPPPPLPPASRDIKEPPPVRRTRGVRRGVAPVTTGTIGLEKNITTPAEPGTQKALTSEGQLEYDIPGSMQVGQPYTCKVNIADKTVAAALLKISETSEHQNVRITDEMSVKLIDTSGGKNFSIMEINSERQAILPNEITTWTFKVRPIEKGRHSLLLKVTIHLQNKNKDLDVLEKEVLVSSTGNGLPASSQTAPKRILFLSANPVDSEMLRINAEARKIKEELQMSTHRDNILFTVEPAVTPRTMTRSILREKPTIIHFSGHGEEEGLCLETENGTTKLIGKSALDSLFSSFSRSVQCVLLNACYSKEQAEVIFKHIPYVIGMQQAIEDEAAIAFAVGFYQAIGEGEDIETAYNIGMASMAMEAEDQKEIPVLLQKTLPV
jgi:N-acetyl-anhydromuramyl-L-alanine amidase AmpD/lysophospholipase L1-like esterase